MVLTVLIGKRMLELLKDSKDEPKNTKDIILTGTKVNVSIPNHPKVII